MGIRRQGLCASLKALHPGEFMARDSTPPRPPDRERRASPVERVLERATEGLPGVDRPLSDRARQAQRSVESYLLGSGRPRWMERVMEIDSGIAAERRRLREEYVRLAASCHDQATFAAEWEARAGGYEHRRLNELIDEHNDWYPIERDLPMDPRTGDYVKVRGRSYRRPRLDRAWVLESFPAVLARARAAIPPGSTG